MLASPNIALATCDDLPGWEVDDLPLHAALGRAGARVTTPTWTDPTVDWAAFDAVLVRTTWDYAPQRAAFVAWAHRVEAQTRLFNPAPVLQWNTDKRYLRELADGGLPLAPTLWFDAGEDAHDAAARIAQAGWRSGFIKPVFGASARETLRFTCDASGLACATEHLARLLPTEPLIAQPYLRRVETEGELSAIYIDGRRTHCVRKRPVPGDYRVQDDFGASDQPERPSPALATLFDSVVAHAQARWGALLYARVDLMFDDSGAPVLTELELVEPSLFLRHGPHAAEALADALLDRVRADR